MSYALRFFLAILLLLPSACSTGVSPRHIIVMIADGWGFNHLDAGAYWNGGRQPYEVGGDWFSAAMSTYMYCEGEEEPPYGDGEFVGLHGYDRRAAWADWRYMLNFATDSAAASTAIFTGRKTYGGAIGMGVGDGTAAGRETLINATQRAFDRGMFTGVVTSVQLSHATPAGVCAHSVSRTDYAAIAREMIADPALGVIMGAGHPNYDDNGAWDPGDPGEPRDWAYVGGHGQWEEMVNGTAGGSVPWVLVEEKGDFAALAVGTLEVERVFGVPRVAHTLQYDRDGIAGYDDPTPPYAMSMIENVPDLAMMTRGALRVLSRNRRGFILMVEGGAIDWASHDRVAGRMIEELDDFNRAVSAVNDGVES